MRNVLNSYTRIKTSFLGATAAIMLILGLAGCAEFNASQPAQSDTPLPSVPAELVARPEEATPTPAVAPVSMISSQQSVETIFSSPTPDTALDQTETAPVVDEAEPPAPISSYLSADLSPQTLFENPGSELTALAVSPDTTWAAAGYSDGSVYLLPMSEGSPPFELGGHVATIRDLDFSPDGASLASAGEDSRVKIWDTADGTLTMDINTTFVGRALAVEYSPDGTQIAIGGHKCFIAIYNTWSGILNRTLVQPNCSLKSEGSVDYWEINYSADGAHITAADGQPSGGGGSIQKWSLEPFAQPEIIKGLGLGISTMAITPDESLAAVSLIGSPQILLINTADGRLIQTLEGHQHRVNSLDFSADGRMLVSGSTDGTVRLWDPNSGLLIRNLVGHEAAVNRVEFTPDGTSIISGSDDGLVVLWSFSMPK